ncbi:MAG: hypothetical protein ACRBBW_18335 [Cellvibrionaceae bacterium]
MKKLVITIANFMGIFGVSICAISGALRVAEVHQLFGYENMTLFIAGTGIMVASMLIKQELILWKTHHSTG